MELFFSLCHQRLGLLLSVYLSFGPVPPLIVLSKDAPHKRDLYPKPVSFFLSFFFRALLRDSIRVRVLQRQPSSSSDFSVFAPERPRSKDLNRVYICPASYLLSLALHLSRGPYLIRCCTLTLTPFQHGCIRETAASCS